MRKRMRLEERGYRGIVWVIQMPREGRRRASLPIGAATLSIMRFSTSALRASH